MRAVRFSQNLLTFMQNSTRKRTQRKLSSRDSPNILRARAFSSLFELIDHAKKNEPNNASLYYVEGNIYKQLGKTEEAIKAYYSCSGINPDYEFGFIGAGILYYELALEYQDKAQNEFDDKKYEALVAEFEKALESAFEPFEKAFEISKDDSIKVNIAEYLKNICYRFSSKDPKYEAGYNKYNTIVKNGTAK